MRKRLYFRPPLCCMFFSTFVEKRFHLDKLSNTNVLFLGLEQDMKPEFSMNTIPKGRKGDDLSVILKFCAYAYDLSGPTFLFPKSVLHSFFKVRDDTYPSYKRIRLLYYGSHLLLHYFFYNLTCEIEMVAAVEQWSSACCIRKWPFLLLHGRLPAS